MWDTIKDNINSFLGILFLGIPLIVTLWYERKNTKVKKKKRNLLLGVFAVIVGCILLTWLGVDQINRDSDDRKETKQEKINNEKREQTLTTEIEELKKTNAENGEFLKSLKDKFQIVKDSSNQPKKVIYNTHIEKADNVKIGG
jgi:cell division protein FtsB